MDSWSSGFDSHIKSPLGIIKDAIFVAACDAILERLSPEQRAKYEQEKEQLRKNQSEYAAGVARVFLDSELKPGPTMESVEKQAQSLRDEVAGKVFEELTPREQQRLLYERSSDGLSSAEKSFEDRCIAQIRDRQLQRPPQSPGSVVSPEPPPSLAPDRMNQVDREAESILKGYEFGLKTGAEISGEEMRKLIVHVTEDRDSNAASGEYQALAEFVGRNIVSMSPEALRVFAAYQRAAKESQSQGQTGISSRRMEQLDQEMLAEVHGAPVGNSFKIPQEQGPSSGKPLEESMIRDGSVLRDRMAREELADRMHTEIESLKKLCQDHPDVRLWAANALEALLKMQAIVDGMTSFEKNYAEVRASIEAKYKDDPLGHDMAKGSFEASFEKARHAFEGEFARNFGVFDREMTIVKAILE